MKRTLLICLQLCLFSGVPVVRLCADSITLKSGETFNGSIESVTNGTVLMKVSMSSGAITYEKSFPTNQVSSMKTDPEGEEEFLYLSRYSSLGRMSYTKEQYEMVITKVFLPFLKKYPQSSHSPAVEIMLSEWKSELDKVVNGGCKENDKWYFGIEADAARARICVNLLKQLIDQGDDAFKKRDYKTAASFYCQMLEVRPQCMASLAVIEKRMDLALDALKASAEIMPKDPREEAKELNKAEERSVANLKAAYARENPVSVQFYSGGQPLIPNQTQTIEYKKWSATGSSIIQYNNARAKQEQLLVFSNNLNSSYRRKLDEIKKLIAQKQKTSAGKTLEEIWVP